MMNELVDIWKNKIPASCFQTVFEEQAKLLATASITNIALFNESALLAINQEGGGFSSFAVVSLIPRLRAALSQVALSVISILPDTEPHVPLATCEYATE